MKTKECAKCGKQFPLTICIEGKFKSLKSRQFCLNCSPYRGDKCKKLHCKKCGKLFPSRAEGKAFYNRAYCLDCVPFGTRLQKTEVETRECSVCDKKYSYIKKKGHKANRCNSCVTTAKHIARKKLAIEYKGGKCICCGYSLCYASMDFHHVFGKKDFNISRSIGKKWETVLAELDKCVLVCRNCHGELHHGMRELPNEIYGKGNR